jgi:hypothetical protein
MIAGESSERTAEAVPPSHSNTQTQKLFTASDMRSEARVLEADERRQHWRRVLGTVSDCPSCPRHPSEGQILFDLQKTLN